MTPEELKAAKRAEIWLVVLTIICVGIVAWFGMGCATLGEKVQKEIDRLPWRARTETPPQVEPTPEPEKPQEQASQRFLWKPVSESRAPRCAVLLPARIETESILINGTERVRTKGRSNGNRLTFFLARTGSQYGTNVRVEAAGETWIVPNGANRMER